MVSQFENLIGQQARVRVTTGKTGFADIFARDYVLTITAANDEASPTSGRVTARVVSVDITPNGYPLHGSKVTHRTTETEYLRGVPAVEVLQQLAVLANVDNFFNSNRTRWEG